MAEACALGLNSAAATRERIPLCGGQKCGSHGRGQLTRRFGEVSEMVRAARPGCDDIKPVQSVLSRRLVPDDSDGKADCRALLRELESEPEPPERSDG